LRPSTFFLAPLRLLLDLPIIHQSSMVKQRDSSPLGCFSFLGVFLLNSKNVAGQTIYEFMCKSLFHNRNSVVLESLNFCSIGTTATPGQADRSRKSPVEFVGVDSSSSHPPIITIRGKWSLRTKFGQNSSHRVFILVFTRRSGDRVSLVHLPPTSTSLPL
jgi:hypothetical protein